jgi:hypothetical protein
MEVPTIWQRPDVLSEAVDAWRAWAVVELDGELRLSSLTRPERWDPRTPVTAICRHPTHLRPRRWCTCGVYAVPRPELLAGLGTIAGGVIGQVSLWGRIVEHERGLRAQAAYPARVGLVCVVCLTERTGRRAEVVDREERAPGVAVLRPLCHEHAPDAPGLRPAAEVEEGLRAVYAVDALPSDVVERIHEGRPEIEGADAARRRRMVVTRAAALAVAGVLAFPAIRALDVAAPIAAPAASPSANPLSGASMLGVSSAGGYLDSYPQHRLTVEIPEGLDTPRCARVRADRVDETACIDGAFNAYVWDTAPMGRGPEACRGGTVDTTVDDRLDLVLCWRLLRHPG